MTYIPHLIANWATGFDRELQPWLLPVDAQTVLLDGFVYRGVWQKRDGYDGYANGDRGGSPLTESRMVNRIANAAMTGAINSSNTTYTITATTPVRRGTFSVTSSNPSQTLVDNGVGGFTGPGTGTINYTTGAVSVTFTSAPTSGTVVANYDVHQGFPVMGVMTFYTATNVKQLIVADTTYVNIYNPTTNRLDDISPSYPLTGTPSNFFTWTNYDAPNATPRLLFVNDKDEIQRYNGTTVSPFPVFLNTGPPVTGATFFTPTTISPGPYTWATPVPVLPSTVSIKEATDSKVVTDDGFGNLVGDGSGTIDYLTGVATVTFNSGLTAGQTITIDYTPLINPIDTALHIFQMKDRLIILGPTVGGVFQGKTILISGTGRFGDIFATQAVAPGGSEVFISGSGLIDISDDSFIDSADFNRDDLIVFTENSTWAFKYTGNDAVPFELNKLDNSRGTQAPYGTISYLNLTTGESPRGFIACDGYSLERTDNKIPRFSFDEINLDEFILCNAGKVDEDRDHYLIYPSPGKLVSDRILITNYEEYNYSIYRLPLSCMGNFFTTEDVTWDDLAEFDSWEEMAIKYSTWDSFIFQAATPIGIGGGHKGEIFSLNEAQSEDYPVLIRNITGTNSNAITLTTDFQQFLLGNIIYLTGIEGAVELNNKQGQVTSVIDNYNFVVSIDYNPFFTFSTYTPNSGQASRVIQFNSVTKKFNPFVDQDKKVRCGWVYFYVTTTGTNLTDLEGDPVDAILNMQVITNDTERATTQPSTINAPNGNFYTVNLTDHKQENGIKKWCKIWVNQVGRFIQLSLSNTQAGAKIQIHALMPGFAPVGRLV